MFARFFCFSFLLALTLCGGSAHAAQIEAIVGFGMKATDARYRDDSWTPVTVFLTGPGARGVGQVKVSARVGSRLTHYIRRVPLRDGNLNETVRFTVLLRNPDRYPYSSNRGRDIHIQLLLDGRKLAEKSVTLPLAENASVFNVLALTKDGAGLPFLQRKKLGLVHRGFNPAQMGQMNYGAQPAGRRANNGIHPLASLRANITDPRALPAAPQAYEMMDAVVLGDIPLDALAEEQISALKLYVQQGGLLLISGNGDLARLKSPFFAEMLPVEVTGIGSVNTQPLGARYGELSTLPGAGVAVRGKLKPEGRALFGTQSGDTLPLVTARDYGSGVVAFTSFDVTASEFRGWKGAHAFWRDLLRSGNSAISPRDILQNAASQGGYYYGSSYTSQLSDALAGKQAASTPSFLTVSLFVGLYILLLVPVSYFILKKLDKRELAWITAPLLILGFTGASYAIAQSIKGGMLTVHRAVVFEGAANDNRFAGYAQMSLYSPARASYDITINGSANAPLLPSEIFTSAYQNIVNELTVDQDKTTTLRNTAVRLWDKRSFDSPVFTSLGDGIEAQTEMADAPGGVNYRATVTNRTSYTLKNCAVISGSNVSDLGDLAPGETRQMKNPIPWVYKTTATALGVPAASRAYSRETWQAAQQAAATNTTEATVRSALSSVMAAGQEQSGYYLNAFGRAPNVFVGWFDDKAVDVKVNGQSAAGAEVNMVVAHLPLPENAPPNIRAAANPFLKKPVLELEDDSHPGGYSR